MKLEFKRNDERYQFMKWGMQAFDTFKVVPPGIGIVHQVNLEYLARGVHEKDGVYYPDTLVGTDSHTTMINGIGVVGWGVGGIEAEAGMLGQPVYFLTPDVVGVHLTGTLARRRAPRPTSCSTVTEMLRKAKVVGKFVEFFGEGAASLPVPDRATIANMAPEYGATMGFFPVDDEDRRLPARHRPHAAGDRRLRGLLTRRRACSACPRRARSTTRRHSSSISRPSCPALAGPKRPQDRIALPKMKESFNALFSKPVAENGFNQPADKLARRYPPQSSMPRRRRKRAMPSSSFPTTGIRST